MARLVDLAWRLDLERLPRHLREIGETGGLELRVRDGAVRDAPASRRTSPSATMGDDHAAAMFRTLASFREPVRDFDGCLDRARIDVRD
jgi:hypothetical protein